MVLCTTVYFQLLPGTLGSAAAAACSGGTLAHGRCLMAELTAQFNMCNISPATAGRHLASQAAAAAAASLLHLCLLSAALCCTVCTALPIQFPTPTTPRPRSPLTALPLPSQGHHICLQLQVTTGAPGPHWAACWG